MQWNHFKCFCLSKFSFCKLNGISDITLRFIHFAVKLWLMLLSMCRSLEQPEAGCPGCCWSQVPKNLVVTLTGAQEIMCDGCFMRTRSYMEEIAETSKRKCSQCEKCLKKQYHWRSPDDQILRQYILKSMGLYYRVSSTYRGYLSVIWLNLT